MDWQSWIWTIIAPIAVILLVIIGRLAINLLRKQRERDEDSVWLLEMAEWILDALEKEGRRRLAEVPQAEVEMAARDVYRQFIAGTLVAKLISEQDFTFLVVDRWRQMAGVSNAVSQAVQRVQALGPAPPSG